MDKIIAAGFSYALRSKRFYAKTSTSRLHDLTANLLITFSLVVTYKMFGDKPIDCMAPSMFSKPWVQYTENYCWAQDTYKMPFSEQVFPDKKLRYTTERRISYYQWVPFFLLIEAVCFRLPSLIWKYLAGHSGIKIHDIVKLAVDERNLEPQVKQTNIKHLTVHLQNALKFHRRLFKRNVTPHKVMRFLNLPFTAFYVTTMYLVTKLLYLINVIVQLLFLNRFMETERYSFYGFGAILDMINGTTWEQSQLFPRVTLCDFKVRAVGANVQEYTVQCVLVINVFNEKIFVFLWFWYSILFVLTLASFIYWFFVSILPWPARWFVCQQMQLSEMFFDPKALTKEVDRFVGSYLKTDGVFVLRMITMHSGVIFGTDLMLSLWKSFYSVEDVVQRQKSERSGSTTVNSTARINWDKLRQRLRNRRRFTKDDDDDDNYDANDGLHDILVNIPTMQQNRKQSSKPKAPAPPPPLPPKPLALKVDQRNDHSTVTDLNDYLLSKKHSV